MIDRSGKLLIEEIFSRDGILEQKIDNYEIRPAQKRLALEVDKALTTKRFLVAEAGTGIGKTFSYLIPALLYVQKRQKKIVISTYTKNLQLQLFAQDLPRIMDILDLNCQIALLMGKGNYFCHSRLARINFKEANIPMELLSRIHVWADETEKGTFEDWPFGEHAYLWQHFAADNDSCRHHFCPYQNKCFSQKARREAQDADIIVVNHHLFFSDLLVKSNGEGGVLPAFSNIIFDEAHRLEEAGVNFLGIRFAPDVLEPLLKDIEVLLPLLAAEKADANILGTIAVNVKDIKDLSKTFFFSLSNFLGQAENQLLAEEWINHFEEQPQRILAALHRLYLAAESLGTLPSDDLQNSLWEIKVTLKKIHADLQHFILADLEDYVFWAGREGKSVGLNGLPLGIDEFLANAFFPELESALFTSATLAVNGEMSFFISSLGIPAERTDRLAIASPFDYSYQAQVMIPDSLPSPTDPTFTKESLALIKEWLPILGPRSLFLFTSYKMLNEVKKQLFPLAKAADINILAQGEQGPHNLLKTFKSTDKAILLGTSRFWEGVDLPGEFLTSLVIFRLPFPVPNDPWIQGKSQQMQEMGMNPFTNLMLPMAIIKFKQGLGRLIRSFNDRGLFFVLDRRVYAANYSRFFMNTFPDRIPIHKGDGALLLTEGKKFWQSEGGVLFEGGEK